MEEKETKFPVKDSFFTWLILERDIKGVANSHTSSWVFSKRAHIDSLDMNVNPCLTGLSVETWHGEIPYDQETLGILWV